MKIPLPQGYEVPDNAQPGEPFEVVATLEMEEDGTFELKAIDGMKIEEQEEPEPEEPRMELPWDND
jgi:hypothetical protein